MTRLLALAATLIVATLLAWRLMTPPAPLPLDAPATAFSAMRALPDLAVIAARPHPVGSPANRQVREHLVGRLRALGLETQVQAADALDSGTSRDGSAWLEGARVENVIGVLPGRDRAAPAVALMSHYDSVPSSPGGADDGIGVASTLEVLRAIKARGVPARDVIVVFTDGEEVGLLGARAFANHPLARRIGFLVNMEAAGGAGRAFMFETGRRNGETIGLFARAAPRPVANSLSVLVYETTAFGTDFTTFKDGVQGVNFAIQGRAFDYHSPTATAAHLDRGSLQDMGVQALGVASAAAFGDLPKPAADVVYADMLGLGVLAYPAAAGWLILLVAVGLLAIGVIRARKADTFKRWDVVRGAGASVLCLLIPAGVLYLFDLALGLGYQARLARAPALEAAAIVAGLGALLAIGALVHFRRREGVAGTWAGLLIVGLAAAIAAQVMAPAAGPVIAWPLLLACAAAATSGLGSRRGPLVLAGIAAFAVAGIGLVAGLGHIAFFIIPLPALAALLWIVAPLLWPLLQPGPNERRTYLLPAMLICIGLAASLTLRLTDPWSPRYPRPTLVHVAQDADTGETWRVSVGRSLSPWARTALEQDGGKVAAKPFPRLFAGQVYVAPARPANLSGLNLAVTQNGDGVVRADFWAAQSGQSIVLKLKPTGDVGPVTVMGKALPGGQTDVTWHGGTLSLTFRPQASAALDVDYILDTGTWPSDAAPLPPRPAAIAPFNGSDTALVFGTKRLSLRGPG